MTITPTDAPEFALLYGEDREVRSDNLADLIGAIIEGYPQMTDAEALVDRDRMLGDVLTAAQRTYLADNALDREPSEDELTAMLREKSSPVEITEWPSDLPPLLELATVYEPYTVAALPTGSVVLFDSANERAFLDALHRLGVVQFFAKM